MATSAAVITDTPRIFVTTYAAYTAGEQFKHGDWVDLDDFSGDYEGFVAHCAELVGEEDPEYMITDFEGFPRVLYSESGLPNEDTFEIINELCEGTQTDAMSAFIELHGSEFSDWHSLKEAFEEAYIGEFESDEDFAEEEYTGVYDIPEHLQFYIDWERVARDLMMGDYEAQDGHYFRIR